ncbi:MAG: ZIP family metal transporter [Pirellulales bacterium]|nr:ZIP family metal transporter [Pirellulales bacterium]
MTPAGLAAIYCVLIVGASLLGGWLPRFIRLTHVRMQVAISFVAGVILGIGLLHLVPHAYFALGNLDHVMLWLMAGFLLMFFLQRLFHFHTHEIPEPNSHSDGQTPGTDPANVGLTILPTTGTISHQHGPECQHGESGHHHDHEHALPTGLWGWLGVFFGLALHSVIDGLALGAAIQAEATEGIVWGAGLGYFLAVFLHKPFDSLSITSLMQHAGWSEWHCTLANLAYAAVAPLGVLLFFMGAAQIGDQSLWLGGTLAFGAGACLCIATSDLLPELQFHSHHRVALSVALLLGLGLAWGLVLVEQQGHDHNSHGHTGNIHTGQGHTGHDHSSHSHTTQGDTAPGGDHHDHSGHDHGP